MRTILFALVVIPLGSAALAGAPDKKVPKIPDGLKALKHPDPLVRYKAVAVLARLGKTAKFAIPELRAALKDNDAHVRVKAAEALWNVEKPAAAEVILPVLLAALKNKSANVRAAVPRVLALLGPKARPAVPALIRLLSDKDLNVRMEAILALGELGPAAVDSAVALLQLTRDADFVLLEPMISVALGSLGAGATPALTKALARKEVAARRMAAYALGLIGPPAKDAAGALCDALQDGAPSVRTQAAAALGKLGKDAPSCVPAVKKALADTDPLVAIEAGLALWRIAGERGGVPVIVQAMSSRDVYVRESACRALAQIGEAGPEAVAALRAALMDREPAVRAAAADALRRTPPDTLTVQALSKALPDKEIHVQLSVVRALGKNAPAVSAVLPVLLRAIKHEDAAIRIRACGIIADLPKLSAPQKKATVAALLDALEDEQRPVQQAAARALRKIAPNVAARAGIR